MNTILIVDDDDQLRKSFDKLLTGEGYVVESASSGEAGLKWLRSNVPNVVILDMRLPGMDGLETFKAIHEMEPKLPVIIMTAYGTTENAIEATAEMGADIRRHHSQALTIDNIQQADQIWVMTRTHLREVLLLEPEAKNKTKCLDTDGNISDPIGQGQAVYRKCADRLGKFIDNHLKELKI